MTKSGLSFAAPLLRPSWSKRFAPRFIALVLLSVFAACGVLLALSGVTGIVAYSLSLRIREIGIRMAMGAGPRDVIVLISRQGLMPALALVSSLAAGFTAYRACRIDAASILMR